MRRVVTIAVALAVAATGCDRGDGDAGGDVEDAAWSAAGVEDRAFATSTEGGVRVLEVRADTSLPIDDQDDSDFAVRAAGITWRTHPEAFDELIVVALHDDVEVEDPLRLTREELTERWGPRPAGLDDGEARTDPVVDEDGELADVLAAGDDVTTYQQAQTELLDPVLEWTADEHFGVEEVDVELSEPEECLTGINGDQPTGTYEVVGEARIEAPDALDRLPSLIERWGEAGLPVVTGAFDDGDNTLQAEVADRGRVLITVEGSTLVLRTATDCLPPGG